MADKSRSSRKKPVSQKRVATVLGALVGTLTISAGALLLMEGGTLGSSPMAAAVDAPPAVLDTVTPLQDEAWDYIIIYESGDLDASSASLADGRVTGGSQLPPNTVRPRANFHFVIDGAGNGGMDGNLEVGTAWQYQSVSAPYANWPDTDVRYYSDKPYNKAIGICMAADLRRQFPSEVQTLQLNHLVHELQERLNIPKEHVLFQWDAVLPNHLPATAEQKAFAERFRSTLN
jgi:hypothetical protein